MNRIVAGGALALAAAVAGAFHVDSQEMYCLSDDCSQAVEEKRLAAEAERLMQMAEAERRKNIASAKSLGSELNEALRNFADNRARTLQELSEKARKGKRTAQSDEGAARSRIAQLAPLFRGAGGDGYLATEEMRETIRSHQIRAIDEEMRIVATESSLFFKVPDQINCDWGEAKCSEIMEGALAEWRSNMAESKTLAERVGLSTDASITELIAGYQSHIDEIERLRSGIHDIELLTIPPATEDAAR